MKFYYLILLVVLSVCCQLGSSCKDKYEECTDWIEWGECDEWMEEYCPKTCNVCSDSGTDIGGCETSNGACIFPFEYTGITYNGCTKTGDYVPWCRTSTDETEEGWWGYCGQECKMHQDTIVITTAPTVTTTEPTAATPTSQCGIENMPLTRISGGSETAPHQFPWMVRLPMGCGGAFITDRHILTAKHCVAAGDWRGEMVKISVHDQHDSKDYEEVEIKDYVMPQIAENHDIAIIILAKSVDLSDNTIGTVCLPASADEDYRGKRALAMGWGWDPKTETQSQKLQKLEMTVDDIQKDLWLYTKVDYNNEGDPLDVCNGDSGGPLVYKEGGRYTIIGTVSGGDYCNNHQGNSGTWNKVTAHLKWIKSVIGN